MVFHHGSQVENIDIFPSKLNFLACGDKKITSWDLRYTNPLIENTGHKKTVTNVKVVSDGARFLSSSSDGYLKVYKS